MSNQPFTVLVEGNIGAGKTTFLNHFRKFEDVCVLPEPLQKWQNVKGVNLLVSGTKDFPNYLSWKVLFSSFSSQLSGFAVHRSSEMGSVFSNVCDVDHVRSSHSTNRPNGEVNGTVAVQCQVCYVFYLANQFNHQRYLISFFRNCFTEAMVNSGVLDRGMYNVLDAWYKHIDETYDLQTDLIGKVLKLWKRWKHLNLSTSFQPQYTYALLPK